MIKTGYGSPRVSSEFLDCSLPLTFDNLSRCSFNCLYCFSTYQRSSNPSSKDAFKKGEVTSVSYDSVKNLFLGKSKSRKDKLLYEYFIKKRVPCHWGGLSDGFCHFEKQYGTSLKLIKFFDRINHPVIFSTKGVVCAEPEYLEVFKKNPSNWNFQFSIITSDEEMARKIEIGVPSPMQRLEAMRKLSEIGCTTVLRFRPYIIGCSDLTAVDLITKSSEAGAKAVSCEFFCLEGRASPMLKERYRKISEAIGFNIEEFYRRTSVDMGYLRLNKKLKEKYALEVYKTARKLGMNVSFSDPDFKELGFCGCCCGFKNINFCKGQFTQAIIHAREHGTVSWDILEPHLDWAKAMVLPDTGVSFINEHLSISNDLIAYSRGNMTVYDYMKDIWNNPNSAKSPYFYFHGKLIPLKLDENGNVIYKYVKESWEDELE